MEELKGGKGSVVSFAVRPVLLHMVLSILSGVISGYALPACICHGAEGLALGVGGLTSIFALVGALTGIGDSTVKRIWSSTTEGDSGIQIEMPDDSVKGWGSTNFDSESRRSLSRAHLYHLMKYLDWRNETYGRASPWTTLTWTGTPRPLLTSSWLMGCTATTRAGRSSGGEVRPFLWGLGGVC